MLVSAGAGSTLRAEVRAAQRPCPEFLQLEQRHGVRLMDWSAVPVPRMWPERRSALHSLAHVASALPLLREADVILTDGEHVGIPLALAMAALGVDRPHVMIAHHLSSAAKAPFFRILKAHRRIDRILVHSPNQVTPLRTRLGLPASLLEVVPYGVDTEFWRPSGNPEERLIVAPGREHRDHRTLADACAYEDVGVFITGPSPNAPRARSADPQVLPRTFQRGVVSYVRLRQLYGSASLVVVPVMPCDFPAGITTLLEAMAMGKPVVVSATRGLAGIVEDGQNGLLVPPGDVGELRRAIHYLLARPAERSRLGRNARSEAVSRFGMELYAARLAGHLAEIAGLGRG